MGNVVGSAAECYPGPVQPKFTFIDLCAGIGGLRLPFDHERQGLPGRCVFTAEIDAAAKLTYARNFCKTGQTVEEAIVEISNDLNVISPKSVPKHDLLLAGFPCQPFSQAGRRLGFNDDRGNIFERIISIVAEKAPKVILLENVRGLKSLKNLDGTLAIDRITSELKNPRDGLKYLVPDPKILNARDFGLPQNRNRLFIIAIRADIAKRKGLTAAEDFKWPEPTHDRESLRVLDFLERRVDDSYTISDRLWEGHQKRKIRNDTRGAGWGYQLFKPSDKYVATISARYFKDGSEALIWQGETKNPRKLTPIEARNLQGFPSNFLVHESKMQAFRQFGNAVPVKVIEALAESVEPYLL